MKYIVIILTICSILGKDIYQATWDIWYVVNKEYVSEKLCENKDIPMLNCNGKCYLSKQLEKAESALRDIENNHKNNRPVLSENIKFAQNFDFQFQIEIDEELTKKTNFKDLDHFQKNLYIKSIDHPPQS